MGGGMKWYMRVLLAVAFALLLVSAGMTAVQAKGGGEGGIVPAGCWIEWRDTGWCCQCWTPGRQDWREQWVVCPDGREWRTGYEDCACFSICW